VKVLIRVRFFRALRIYSVSSHFIAVEEKLWVDSEHRAEELEANTMRILRAL